MDPGARPQALWFGLSGPLPFFWRGQEPRGPRAGPLAGSVLEGGSGHAPPLPPLRALGTYSDILGRQQHSFGVMKGPSCLALEEGPPWSLEPVTSFFQSRDPPPLHQPALNDHPERVCEGHSLAVLRPQATHLADLSLSYLVCKTGQPWDHTGSLGTDWTVLGPDPSMGVHSSIGIGWDGAEQTQG